jgi:hypothetical protein
MQVYSTGKGILFTGDVVVAENNPGNIVVQTRRLAVSNTFGWESKPSSPPDSYYIGYIQILLENFQSNHYAGNVEQRWEFSQLPLSDSLSVTECPWYGIDRDPYTPGLRRAELIGPATGQGDRSGEVVLGMTDDFKIKVAKHESLANGNPGPNALTQIERFQKFRTWLVLVKTNQVSNLGVYRILMQIDWSYKCSYAINIGASSFTLTYDGSSYEEKFGGMVDPIPPLALRGPVANIDQKLFHYLNGIKGYQIPT